MKIGGEVMTPHGKGKIVAKESIERAPRFGVKLENNPFDFSPAYYFVEDLKEIESDSQTKLTLF